MGVTPPEGGGNRCSNGSRSGIDPSIGHQQVEEAKGNGQRDDGEKGGVEHAQEGESAHPFNVFEGGLDITGGGDQGQDGRPQRQNAPVEENAVPPGPRAGDTPDVVEGSFDGPHH